MEQVLALAKVGLAAAQIYLDGVCYSTCSYERLGEEGYWSHRYQACACVTYIKPEDSFLGLKLSTTRTPEFIYQERQRDPEPEAESPSFKLDFDY